MTLSYFSLNHSMFELKCLKQTGGSLRRFTVDLSCTFFEFLVSFKVAPFIIFGGGQAIRVCGTAEFEENLSRNAEF